MSMTTYPNADVSPPFAAAGVSSQREARSSTAVGPASAPLAPVPGRPRPDTQGDAARRSGAVQGGDA